MDAGIDPDRAGFTLIELLVTVAVLSVLAVGASLVAGRRDGAQDDTLRFAQSFAHVRALAVQGQQSRGLEITPKGSTLTHRVAGHWQSVAREVRWRGPVGFVAAGPGPAVGQPDIVFLSNGRTSAFSIRFGDGTKARRCTSDGWTGLACDAD